MSGDLEWNHEGARSGRYLIYQAIGLSGHTLKHVTAAVSVWGVVGIIRATDYEF